MKGIVDIEVAGAPLVLDDWLRAKEATIDVLPGLSEAQVNVAHKFGISEDVYARSVLAYQYGRERTEKRAEKFLAKFEQMLQELKLRVTVARIHSQFERVRELWVWVVDVNTSKGPRSIQIQNELFEAIVDSDESTRQWSMLKSRLGSLVRHSRNLGDAA